MERWRRGECRNASKGRRNKDERREERRRKEEGQASNRRKEEGGRRKEVGRESKWRGEEKKERKTAREMGYVCMHRYRTKSEQRRQGVERRESPLGAPVGQ